MIRRLLDSIIVIIIFTSAGCAQQASSNSISMKEFKEKLKTDGQLILLDVRTAAELTGPLGKIDKSINIPLQELRDRLVELEPYRDKELTVICRTQNRSAAAVNYLISRGFTAKYVLGGMSEFVRP